MGPPEVRLTDEALDRDDLMAAVLDVTPEWVNRDTVILAGLRGSHAHGTVLPPEDEHATEDVDVFVVTAQPSSWYLGLESDGKLYGKHAETHGDHVDVKVYDVRKFGRLLCKGNPNVHNWLWAPEDCYLHVSEPGRMLRDCRELFVSMNVMNAIRGYARGQVHRMTRPAKHGYMGDRRKRLFDRYGYDVKNASHALRTMWMGCSLGFGGIVQVRWEHHRAGLLMAVKRGEFSLTEFRSMVEFYETVLEHAAGLAGRRLPERPDPRSSDVVRDTILLHAGPRWS